MGTTITIVVLLSFLLLLVPVPIVVVLRWDSNQPRRWRFTVRLAGAAIVRLPGRRETRPRSDDSPARLPPWLGRLVDWTVARWKKRSSADSKRKRGGSDPLDIAWHLIKTFLVRPTRSLRLELGGIDPAALASIHGLFLSFEPLVPGNGVIRFRPLWTVFEPRIQLIWSLRVTVAGILGGLFDVLVQTFGKRGGKAESAPTSEAAQPT